MGSSTSYKGPGKVAGAEQQEGCGPGNSRETRGTPDSSRNPMPAASGKGIKPKNRTRGREEDGA